MAKNIMIQGTMSSAGKSLLVTALCRIFRQDGYRVAPFKSQNMALNSYVTPDGLELGRAQAVQAEAAGLECDVRMNPILLKPNSNMGSQLIVNGEVRGNYPAAEYFRMKKSLIPDILSAYESLSSENDMIVIEGAGSPAEINLRADDIVNMGLAELVNAPVLLVGDIDRGGVFAQLYGTAALLRPEERARLEGLVINKFRGDRELLRPGLCQIEDLTGIPVLGVIPWTDADIDDEDSLSPRFSRRAAADALLDLAVIRLPHISNFTDFAPLEACPALGLRYVDRAEKLGRPDLLILPGTKNTISDLQWLRKVGLAEAVLSLAEADVPILGICGGFQMMGKTIRDPEALESGDSSDGLGLLPCETVFFRQKVRTRRNALVETGPFSGVGLTGYEIHMGSTENFGAAAFSRFSDGTADGAQCGNRFGTYLHGLFDSGAMITALTDWLASRKGISLPETASIPTAAYRQQQYDLLADLVRNNLDLDRVYRIMEEYQHAVSSSTR
jgi:adenosylcobyric acid synthase